MQIQPLRFGDALNAWFRSLQRNWKPLLLSSLVAHVPVAVVVAALFWFSDAGRLFDLVTDPDLATMSDAEVLSALTPFFWTIAVWTLLQILAIVFVNLAAARTVAGDLAGESFTWRDVSRFASRRFGKGLAWVIILTVGGILLTAIPVAVGWALLTTAGANFLTIFATTVAGLTTLVVLIWLGVSLSVGAQVIAMEDATAVGAITRSFSMVQSRWWATFGYLALASLIAYTASQVASIVIAPLFVTGALVPGALAVGFGLSVVLQGPLAAAISAAYSIWYVDIRARSEQLTAAQLIQV